MLRSVTILVSAMHYVGIDIMIAMISLYIIIIIIIWNVIIYIICWYKLCTIVVHGVTVRNIINLILQAHFLIITYKNPLPDGRLHNINKFTLV